MSDSPVHKYLCCWKDLYIARAWCPYNIICCPILLILHSIRIYVGTCLAIYLTRLYWLCFACCHSYYEDPDFPPNDKSLGDVSGDTANAASGKSESKVIWVRAGDLSRPDINQRPTKPHLHNTDMQLFHKQIEANDIRQGALGDCWLLASMSCLAEHIGAVDRVFITREINCQGKYKVSLYDPQDEEWKVIVVDDYLPCQRAPSGMFPDGVYRNESMKTDPSQKWPEMMYAKPHGHEIWAMILEKAFAKLCGSYHALEGGLTEWGIVAMTGRKAWRYMVEGNGKEKQFRRYNLTPQKDKNDKRAMTLTHTDETYDSDKFFEILRVYHRNGASLNCGGVKDGEAQGLVKGHAFALLQVATARESATSNKYFQMVQIRNPWGTGEWKGDWSDGSPLWDQYPHVKKTLDYENRDDGLYWMEWKDFIDYWGYVGVVDLNTNITLLEPPQFNDKERSGPLKSFCEGCFRYWFCCQGLRSLYLSHEGSEKRLEEGDMKGRCGMDASGCYCRLCENQATSATAKS